MAVTALETLRKLTRSVVIPCVLLACLATAPWFWFGERISNPSVAPQMVRSTIAASGDKPLYVQKYELTVAEWNRCNHDGACALRIRTKNPEVAAVTPATGLNWFDVQEYLAWLNSQSRHVFRLPTSTEWTALAKDVLPRKPDPIFTDPELTWASAYLTTPKISRKLQPTGSFKTTSDGIVDLNGNVWEWTSDCYAGSLKNVDESKCPAFYVGGEHVAAIPVFTRKPARGGCAVGAPPAHLGLRLVSNDPTVAVYVIAIFPMSDSLSFLRRKSLRNHYNGYTTLQPTCTQHGSVRTPVHVPLCADFDRQLIVIPFNMQHCCFGRGGLRAVI